MRDQVWPVLLGVHSAQSTWGEQEAELKRIRQLYSKLVLLCEELDSQLEALRFTQQEAAAIEQGGQAQLLSLSELDLPGNIAAFAEAHRIIVMDAIRTDFRSSSSDASAGNPTVTILPVAVSDGLPELMLVESLEPSAKDAVAAGTPPLWRSGLITAQLGSAMHITEDGKKQILRLVNLLSAYSIHDPETGYCQGM